MLNPYMLHITPLYAGNMDEALAQLSTIIKLDEETREDVLARSRKGPSFRPILIRDSLTQRELSRLAIRSAYLPGVTFEKSLRRIYPQGAFTGHVTGYVSPVTSREIEDNRALGELPDLATGKIGIEYAWSLSCAVFRGVSALKSMPEGARSACSVTMSLKQERTSGLRWILACNSMSQRYCAEVSRSRRYGNT